MSRLTGCTPCSTAGLMTDFMASRRAGSLVRCEDYPPHHQPPSCRNAYSDVVWWSTCTSFATNSVLTFIMVSLEDSYAIPLDCGKRNPRIQRRSLSKFFSRSPDRVEAAVLNCGLAGMGQRWVHAAAAPLAPCFQYQSCAYTSHSCLQKVSDASDLVVMRRRRWSGRGATREAGARFSWPAWHWATGRWSCCWRISPSARRCCFTTRPRCWAEVTFPPRLPWRKAPNWWKVLKVLACVSKLPAD